MIRDDERSFFEDDFDHATTSQSSATQSAQYLLFTVAGMELGLPLEHVSEVLPYEQVSDLPGRPAFMRGVVQVRGRVTPVVDVAVKLGRPASSTNKRTCILMIEIEVRGERVPLGIVMDGVATLLDVERVEIQKPPRLGMSLDVRYLDGLVQTPRGMLPLINFARVFTDTELDGVQTASSQSTPSPP